jgi:hypothetical protein
MREAATISMARVICDTFFAEPMRRLISRVLGISSLQGSACAPHRRTAFHNSSDLAAPRATY